MDYQVLKQDVEQKTAQTLEVLQNSFAGLRTGRASTHLLDGVRVSVYGSDMPLNQVATVSTPDNSTAALSASASAMLSMAINVESYRCPQDNSSSTPQNVYIMYASLFIECKGTIK